MPDVRNRAATKKAREEANKARADKQNNLRISFKKIKDELALLEIIRIGKEYVAYHSKLAKDGVGYRDSGQRDISGNLMQELVTFTHEKRVSELDKAAGIEELVDYIERHIKDENLTPVAAKKVVS